MHVCMLFSEVKESNPDHSTCASMSPIRPGMSLGVDGKEFGSPSLMWAVHSVSLRNRSAVSGHNDEVRGEQRPCKAVM